MNYILKSWNRLVSILDNHSKGFSMRKVVALTFVVLTYYIEMKYVTSATLTEVIIINLSFIAILLGIVTFEQILKFKEGNKNEPKDTPEA